MGLDIIVVSKAKYVACSGTSDSPTADECLEKHWPVGPFHKRRDGLKPGCYVAGHGGRATGFDVNYAAYNHWRRHLSILALGVPPEEVWDNPRRFRGKPFVELIDFPDVGDFTIGPKTAAKLHADFVAFARKAKHYYFTQEVIPTPRREEPRAKRDKTNRSGRRPAGPVVHGSKAWWAEARTAGIGTSEALARAIGGVIQPDWEEKAWMWEVYCDFRNAFKLASNDGFVSFC